MLLRPQSGDKYTVIGACYAHGLMDAEALLGPLPEDWTIRIIEDSGEYLTVQQFFNSKTDVLTTEDPRLAPLADQWEKLEREKTRDDPEIFRDFRNKSTGEIMNSDPRLLPQALKERGVKLRTLELI